MHRLDNHINDIEPRIKAIYENAPKQGEPSLQESLSSYGWILLDSWVAWRTLRFLLKETFIDEYVNDKWFQTPSSYTASQLKAIWNFSETTMEYLNQCTGKNFKGLVDNTIQVKRNSSAHFSRKGEISGNDSMEIKKIYQVFSKIFLFYETGSFMKIVCDKLRSKGYLGFEIVYPNNVNYKMEGFLDSIILYTTSIEFTLKCCKPNEQEYIIIFQKLGCVAGKMDTVANKYCLKSVVNEEQKKYNFFGTKGFYRNIDLFVSTVESCWL